MNPPMTKTILCAFALGLSFTTTHADTFGRGVNTFTIDFVSIGNAGNGDDVAFHELAFGGVPYVFRMGVTEVPEVWITEATASGLTNVRAGAWTGNQPAGDMTWIEMAAFVNFLNTSTDHQAAYQLNASNTALTLWSSAEAWQLGGENLYRHKDAYYFLPSEDEWYKAAYHKNDGVTANYWNYATGSDSVPTAVASGMGAGTAVYNNVTAFPAAVNDAGGLSPYGTRGQNGNALELLESALDETNDQSSENRVARGGDWRTDLDPPYLERFLSSTSNSAGSLGFRVASVPEPSCAMLLLSGSLLALARSRRRTSSPPLRD